MCGLFVESTAIDNRPPTLPVVTALIFDHEEEKYMKRYMRGK